MATKKTWRSIILLLLVCVMCFSLCACGSSGESNSTEADSNAATPEQTAASGSGTTADTSYVYKTSFTSVTGDENVSYMSAMYWAEDGVYCTGSKIIGTHVPEGVEPQYYGQFDDTETAVYFLPYDGALRELENYAPVAIPVSPLDVTNQSGEDSAPAAEQTVAAEEMEDSGTGDGYTEAHPCDGVWNYTNSAYISALNILPDGNLLLCEGLYLSWTDTDEYEWSDEEYYDHYHYAQYTYLRILDSTGKELSSVCMEVPVTEWLYTSGECDENGNVLFNRSTETGEYYVTAIDPATGEKAYEILMEDSLSNIYKSADGTVYALVWGNDGNQLLKLDPATKKFSYAVTLPGEAYTVIPGGGDYPFYYTSGVHCYGFDPASEEGGTKIFSWMDCDVDPDTACYAMSVDSSGTIRTLVTSFDSYTMTYDRSLAVIRKTEYDPSMQKQELTLATQSLSTEMRNAIITFNRKSDSTRIVVRDYSEYNTDEDYSAGLQKLQTEIMAGNCPDLIDMTGLSFSQIASKGLLEDLYPYLDADPELNREDYYANVLAAAESDGKLMHTVSYFLINTVVGASDIVGEEPGWTYEDLNSALLEMPEGCTAFSVSATQSSVLNTCLNLDMSNFVDWSTKKVNFDTEEFIALLKFAADFQDDYDWELYDWQTDSDDVRISEGRQMLYSTAVAGVDTLNYIEAMYSGAQVTFIGYPTYNGTGNTIEVDSGCAMSTSCADKEAAWQFLRTLFTASFYENSSYYGLPVQKELLEKKLKKACTPTYEIDDNGEYKLDANGEKIMEQHYYAFNSAVYTYYALSEELADQFRNLLETTTKVSVIDENIKNIVSKQSEAFFTGQKSAEEVAKLIQNNAQIYVSERG